MIKFENISKTYREGLRGRKIKGISNLNLSIHAGEVFGFLGPNGAGKSTTIKILIDLIRPDTGSVTIAGVPVTDPLIRKQVGYLPENPYFYDHLTAEELLWFGGKSTGMSNGAVRERCAMLLRQVELSEVGSRRLRTYSKGMVQRAGLALALIHDPSVIVLDEPMSGLDPLGRKMVVDLILDLKNSGKTVFFSSHILADIERICDRIGIIARGELTRVAGLAELTAGGRGLEEVFIEATQCALGGSLT